MPDSMYSDLLLLRDLNFFPSLDPTQSNLSLASDQSPDECPFTEACLSCLFEKWAWHSPEDCDEDCPQVAVNASDGHLDTCLIEAQLRDTCQNQTVRVTDYCIGSILMRTYLHSSGFSCNHTVIFMLFPCMWYLVCGFGDCEARACYSAELHVPRRTVTASTSETRIITILLCSLCTLCTASKSLLNTKLTPK